MHRNSAETPTQAEDRSGDSVVVRYQRYPLPHHTTYSKVLLKYATVTWSHIIHMKYYTIKVTLTDDGNIL